MRWLVVAPAFITFMCCSWRSSLFLFRVEPGEEGKGVGGVACVRVVWW